MCHQPVQPYRYISRTQYYNTIISLFTLSKIVQFNFTIIYAFKNYFPLVIMTKKNVLYLGVITGSNPFNLLNNYNTICGYDHNEFIKI